MKELIEKLKLAAETYSAAGDVKNDRAEYYRLAREARSIIMDEVIPDLNLWYDLLVAARRIVDGSRFYHSILSCDLHRLPVSVPERGIDYRPSEECTCAIGPLAAAIRRIDRLP